MSFFASLDKRRWITALVALALAFASGYVMQNVLADKTPVATIQDAPDAAPVMRSGEEPKPLPTPPAATLMPILERPPVDPERFRKPGEEQAQEMQGCEPRLTVAPAPAATVRIDLLAPCHAETAILVTQGDVTGTARTDRSGALQLRVPALSAQPVIGVMIGAAEVRASVDVPEAEDFAHVALQWSGPQALRINAYEFGAQKSQFGHVWSGAPKSPSRASRGSGGFLTRIGDGNTGASAEIYSFPAGQAPVRGVVRLVVEAEVTKANCGRKVHATALQSSPLGGLRPTDVALSMPGCDRVGEIVRLQNLLQDMRLAGR